MTCSVSSALWRKQKFGSPPRKGSSTHLGHRSCGPACSRAMASRSEPHSLSISPRPLPSSVSGILLTSRRSRRHRPSTRTAGVERQASADPRTGSDRPARTRLRIRFLGAFGSPSGRPTLRAARPPSCARRSLSETGKSTLWMGPQHVGTAGCSRPPPGALRPRKKRCLHAPSMAESRSH